MITRIIIFWIALIAFSIVAWAWWRNREKRVGHVEDDYCDCEACQEWFDGADTEVERVAYLERLEKEN